MIGQNANVTFLLGCFLQWRDFLSTVDTDKRVFFVVFTKSLCHVIEVMCGPLMQTFKNRLERNKRKTEQLLREKEELERRLEALRNA